METTVRLSEVETLRTDRNAAVDAFFEALRTAQTGFLDTVGHAQSLLDRENGQLAQSAAAHARLTRHFFDGQRSILMRRAEIDAEVAQMGVPASTFGADDPVIASAERQLTRLLDDWWHAENQKGRALIEHAKAAIQWQDAPSQVAPPQVAPPTVATPPVSAPSAWGAPCLGDVPVATDVPKAQVIHPESASHLPASMLSALDSATPADLEQLFDKLAEFLENPPTVPSQALVSVTNDLAVVGDHTSTLPSGVGIELRHDELVEPEEAFRRFWGKGSTAATSRSPHWIATQVVLPMAVVMSLVALYMAVFG
jgi:hypothetical protein